MPGLIQALVLTLSLGLSTGPANTSYFGNLTNPVHPALRSIQPADPSLKKAKGQFIKFGMTIPNRPVNGRYSLGFTIEPVRKDLVLRKGKLVVGTRDQSSGKNSAGYTWEDRR